MEQYYLVLLAFLGVIAVIDLFVGVSNDAVNFLNSALGCRISSFRTTLWVASIGVLAGATFSSGMMEIARSGVFHPQLFTFSELMIVFFAVMVADVILLAGDHVIIISNCYSARASRRSRASSCWVSCTRRWPRGCGGRAF